MPSPPVFEAREIATNGSRGDGAKVRELKDSDVVQCHSSAFSQPKRKTFRVLRGDGEAWCRYTMLCGSRPT